MIILFVGLAVILSIIVKVEILDRMRHQETRRVSQQAVRNGYKIVLDKRESF